MASTRRTALAWVAAAGALLVLVAVSLVGHEALSPTPAVLASQPPKTPSWLVAPPTFNLKKEDKSVKAGLRAVQALHASDANFPVENREGNLGPSAAKTGGRAQGVYPRRFSATTSHAARGRGSDKKAKAAVETPADEWQADRSLMYKAVHAFHKYGDQALEALIPAKKTEHEYKSALKKGLREVDRLKDAREQDRLDAKKASGALSAVEKGIAEQDALKREALKAKDEGKEYAAKMKIQDLKRQLKLQEERDRRREGIVKAQVARLAEENRELRTKDSKISMEMEEVPADGAREGNLMALRKEITNLQRSESDHVKALEDEVFTMKEQMARLGRGVGEKRASYERGPVAEEKKPQAIGMVDTGSEMSSKQLLELAREESANEEHEREEEADDDDVDQAKEEEDKAEMASDSAQDSEAMYKEESEDSEYSEDGEDGDADPECLPCESGDDCYAGCKAVTSQERAQLRQREMQKDVRDGVNPVKDHQLALMNAHPAGYNIVPMGADAVMPKDEEFGSNIKHCRSGNCEPLEGEGVKVDGWGFGQSDKSIKGFYRMLPLPHLDPSAENSVVRAMNQRKGRFAQYNKAGQPGVFTPGSSWGANSKWPAVLTHDHSPGAKKLEAKGVVIDKWPVNIYKGMALPGFDKSNWDHTKNVPFNPSNPNKFNRESNEKLEKAGVLVSETPTVDGEADTKIPYQPVPQYRRSGIARQEKPLYFMLRPHVNLAAPQPVIDRKRGLEYDDEYSQEGRKHGEYGFTGIQDTLGCGPQGCFDQDSH